MAKCPFSERQFGRDQQCPETSVGVDGCRLWMVADAQCTTQKHTILLQEIIDGQGGGGVHTLGGTQHSADTLANLNTKVSDAELDDKSATRTPAAHTAASHSDIASTGADIDDAVSKKHANTNDHAEAHSVASHSDTTATGAELEALTDGGQTALHSHAGGGGGADVKSGYESVADGANQAVTFTTPFAATPNVVVGFSDNQDAVDVVEAGSVTVNGFTIYVKKGHGGGNHTHLVHWIATDAGNS